MDPFGVFVSQNGTARFVQADTTRATRSGVLGALADLLAEFGSSPDPGCPVPFQGGAAGYLSYDLGAEIEALPPPRSRDLDLPELELGFYDCLVGWNHRTGSCIVVSTGRPLHGDGAGQRAERRAAELIRWIRGESAPSGPRGELAELAASGTTDPVGTFEDGEGREYRLGQGGLTSGFTRRGYEDAVRKAIEKVRAGDIFQVNLSQRFSAPAPEDPAAFYLDLRHRAPAPFGAWFVGARCSIASASPERFVSRSAEGRLEVRPIKGTRPRGADPDTDRRLAAELLASDKDRAENLMIADLMRNDVSRVSEAGSVRAASLFGLESYATVHHLVSVIHGQVRPGIGPVDLIRAMFPCGSVTGAPKIRAMELIAEIEPVARGLSYGSLGWIGFDGRMDLSVAIRTVVLGGGRAVFHAGGAVVADSNPAEEYRETLDKARALAGSLSFEL
jgi:para-aminobenzoate synthetase component 1